MRSARKRQADGHAPPRAELGRKRRAERAASSFWRLKSDAVPSPS
eukprot:CAMPEP_0179853362 /NCGR_PEP_ID=MMETSP0982-20121206/9314_1 /TAXON_ID=483367 /ORGANISM="non described non described, Strain CCMP 2436" /LENGTH=44 /DNA_ID= /DNA_START= /DNA_END= /DNA_ORIENTATION=